MRYHEISTPKKFWLVFDIPTAKQTGDSEWHDNRRALDHKIITDVAKGELHGVRGISGTKEIMTDWFVNCRNATLVFDPQQLMSVNNIERVEYENVEYLCADGFRVIYRLWNKERGGKGGNLDHYGLMMNLGDYWKRAYAKVNKGNASSLDYYGITSKLAFYWQDHAEEYTINSFDDAVAAFQQVLLKIGFEHRLDDMLPTPEELRTSLYDCILKVGQIYANEQEWLIKDDHLTIPQGSTLLLSVYPEIARTYEEWKANPDDWKFMHKGYRYEHYQRLMQIVKEYNLHRIYKIKLINGERFMDHGPEVTRRRRERAEAKAQ